MKLLLTLLLVLVVALPGFAMAATQETTLPEIEDEVMCPICGTLLGLSRAPAAERQRVFIRAMIRDGAETEEIKDALVVEYGPQVLALPDDEGINLWAYVVPILVFALAAAGVLWAVIQWRRNQRGDPPGGSASPGPATADSQRLDQDMARFDL